MDSEKTCAAKPAQRKKFAVKIGSLLLHRRTPLVALTTLAVGAAAVLCRVDPNAADSLLPPCPLYALTGLFCPGCGSTRCLHALVHADVVQALAMNPLLVLALPPVILLSLSAAGLLPQRLQRFTHQYIARPWPWLALVVGYGIARNLPWFPFVLLAPG